MTLHIEVPELRAQASLYVREIFRARWNRQIADGKVRNVGRELQSFSTELSRAHEELNALLVQATLSLSEAENRVTTLNAQVERAIQNKNSAIANVRANENRVRDLQRNTGSAPMDSGTALSISNAQRALSTSQSRLAGARTEIIRAQDRANAAQREVNSLNDVVADIRAEIEETNRQTSKMFVAALKVNDYESTKAFFQASMSQADTLVENIRTFATDIAGADAESAQRIERGFIASLTLIPTALSQVGAFETSDNFVAGKPYGQQSLAWCADFIRWVLEDSGIDIDSNGRDALASSYAVARAWAYYGSAGGGYGRWGTAGDAQPGDLLIDRYNGTPTPGGHISIIIEVNVNGNPNLVRTIGGNEEDPTGSGSPDAVRDQIKDLTQHNRYLVTLAELNN